MKTAKQISKKKKLGQKGFTLLEILVVLTIMGFLIAMVAPRLAGISGDAVDTVCDTNQNRMVTYMASYFEKKNRFPNLLTNLVEETVEGVYDTATSTWTTSPSFQIPAVSDGDPENGAETIAAEFNARNHLHLHYLTDEEAAEIRGMGIVSVYNLNSYDGIDDSGAIKEGYTNVGDSAYGAPTDMGVPMEKVTVSEGVAVAMVGMGIETFGGTTFTIETTETGWGEPDFIGRIVFGMGAESALIKDGVIANAAHCPGGIQNADNVTYNDYNLVLPRLSKTVDRFTSETIVSGTTPVEINAYSYGEDDATPTTATIDDYTTRTFSLEAQETWQFATMCPEGHMYPADDGDFWAIDLDGQSDID